MRRSFLLRSFTACLHLSFHQLHALKSPFATGSRFNLWSALCQGCRYARQQGRPFLGAVRVHRCGSKAASISLEKSDQSTLAAENGVLGTGASSCVRNAKKSGQ